MSFGVGGGSELPGSMIEQPLGSVEAVPTAQPFTGPDHTALLAQMTAGEQSD
jgi:hypothetical protein